MAAEAQLRSLYRSVLRELPARVPSVPSSPLRASIRNHLAQTSANETRTEEWQAKRRQEADQFIQYLKAQRMYLTLLDRYNPGRSMDEEERVRLTARRVGMEMPAEWYEKKKT